MTTAERHAMREWLRARFGHWLTGPALEQAVDQAAAHQGLAASIRKAGLPVGEAPAAPETPPHPEEPAAE